jgi:cytochrome P450
MLRCAISVKDPDLFKPGRWASDHPSAANMKELFFPFSLRKRNCVGQNLANLEMKVALAAVCRSFRFELASEVDHNYFLTLRPVNVRMRAYSV